jgi:hypothetical protein
MHRKARRRLNMVAGEVRVIVAGFFDHIAADQTSAARWCFPSDLFSNFADARAMR